MLMANNLTYNNVINAEGNPSHSPSPGHQIELQNAQLCIVRLSFGELFLDILLKISHRVLQHWMRKSGKAPNSINTLCLLFFVFVSLT